MTRRILIVALLCIGCGRGDNERVVCEEGPCALICAGCGSDAAGNADETTLKIEAMDSLLIRPPMPGNVIIERVNDVRVYEPEELMSLGWEPMWPPETNAAAMALDHAERLLAVEARLTALEESHK